MTLVCSFLLFPGSLPGGGVDLMGAGDGIVLWKVSAPQGMRPSQGLEFLDPQRVVHRLLG